MIERCYNCEASNPLFYRKRKSTDLGGQKFCTSCAAHAAADGWFIRRIADERITIVFGKVEGAPHCNRVMVEARGSDYKIAIVSGYSEATKSGEYICLSKKDLTNFVNDLKGMLA